MYVPFPVGSKLNAVFKWDQGGSKVNSFGFKSSKMWIRSGAKTNQWGEISTAPTVLYKIAGDFDAQVLLEFDSMAGIFAGMGVRRIADEEWWLRAGRTGDGMVVDVCGGAACLAPLGD